MEYRILITKSARVQLDEIIFYLVNELFNEKAASDFSEKIYKRFNDIKTNPYMYEVCRDSRLKIKTYRKIVVDNYVIIYKVDKKLKNIFVVGIFYCGQEYNKYL